MCPKMLIYFVLILMFINKEILAVKSLSRQKRCIVIQKQSGSHGDSNEDAGDDDDYRKPTPRSPSLDRLRGAEHVRNEVENVQPEFLKYKTIPVKRANNEKYRFKNRFFRNLMN